MPKQKIGNKNQIFFLHGFRLNIFFKKNSIRRADEDILKYFSVA